MSEADGGALPSGGGRRSRAVSWTTSGGQKWKTATERIADTAVTWTVRGCEHGDRFEAPSTALSDENVDSTIRASGGTSFDDPDLLYRPTHSSFRIAGVGSIVFVVRLLINTVRPNGRFDWPNVSNVKVEDARTVLAVAEFENLTRAAEARFCSPPTASAAVRRVESEFGLAVFVRGRTGMHLTPAGTGLIDRLRDFVATHDSLTSDQDAPCRENQLHVGTVLGYGAPWLQAVADEQERDDPSGPIVVATVFDWTDVTAGLRSRTTDAAILNGPTTLDDKIQSRLIGYDSRVAVMHRDHPLATRDVVTLADLDEYGWCIGAVPNSDPVWFRYWHADETRNGTPPHVQHRCSTANELIAALHDSKGVCTTLASRRFATYDQLVYIDVADLPPCPIRIGWLQDRDQPIPESLVRLLGRAAGLEGRRNR